jgi:flagellar biogenesis protein FliO
VGMVGVVLAVAICGTIGVWARRFSFQTAPRGIQVVGRISLSPKHTVYLLRVGPRVLLLGAGPQGAPSLIGELDEFSDASWSPVQGEEA